MNSNYTHSARNAIKRTNQTPFQRPLVEEEWEPLLAWVERNVSSLAKPDNKEKNNASS